KVSRSTNPLADAIIGTAQRAAIIKPFVQRMIFSRLPSAPAPHPDRCVVGMPEAQLEQSKRDATGSMFIEIQLLAAAASLLRRSRCKLNRRRSLYIYNRRSPHPCRRATSAPYAEPGECGEAHRTEREC